MSAQGGGFARSNGEDPATVINPYEDLSVLITGGTGSFGSTMVRRLLGLGVRQVRILSRDEAKQDELRRSLSDERARFYVGDVRDFASVADAVRGVDLVFHAAALKQVPSCEFFPLEAVRTNVVGSANVIEAARRNRVRSVVCLSTDKAVYPVNAMGMSKALMEKVAQSLSRDHQTGDTVVSSVRYGNVLYSRGSVVPLFFEQVREGRPLSITDPEMTRFLMSLDEAVRLVEHAFESARPGDLFVRKAPACTVADLATAVAGLAGRPDHPVSSMGTRHGEKLYETLVSREEMARAEDQGEFFRVPLDDRGLNYHLFFDAGDAAVRRFDEYNSHNTQQLGPDAVKNLLLKVPDVRAQVDAAEST